MTNYTKGSPTVYHHHYHIVWITKYRYKILKGEIQKRVRSLIVRGAGEMGVKILNGVVSSDHVHIMCSVPPQVRESDFVQKAKGMSSRKIQQEFSELKNIYWGRRFWGRGYFSTTSGNVTDEIINNYINNHVDAHKNNDEENISLE